MKYYQYLNGSIDMGMANLSAISNELNQRVKCCCHKNVR